jgi:hypothetical protein
MSATVHCPEKFFKRVDYAVYYYNKDAGDSRNVFAPIKNKLPRY